MKVLNIGSMNIDRVYRVKNFVKPKETIKAKSYEELCGGKGLNQSVAIAKAGGEVIHAGALGKDGGILLDMLKASGVNVGKIKAMDSASGHAMIQVDDEGQNNIIIHGGTNELLTKEYIKSVIEILDKDDIVLLQNEVSNVAYAIEEAYSRGIKIIFNPSPISEELNTYDLSKISYFIVNEIEAQSLVDISSEDPYQLLQELRKKFRTAAFILTMGEKGSYYMEDDTIISQPIFKVKAVDTTGAGDTFCGYFLACLTKGLNAGDCLKYASAASAIAVSKSGAAVSIPFMAEVNNFLGE